MEVVNRLPKPQDPEALGRLVDAQRILCARCVSEEDGQQAVELLTQLAEPTDAGGYGYFPALLTLASLHATGFEPAVERDRQGAAGFYLRALSHERAAAEIPADMLSEAATELCNVVKEGALALEGEELRLLQGLARGDGAGSLPGVSGWARFALTEVERTVRANSEDPEARERRLAREAARKAEREREVAEQKAAAAAALARAEELRVEGNDACRQGQLPGNSRASQELLRASQLYREAEAALTDCLASGLEAAPQEAKELRRQRCVLLSNAAQVQVSLGDWEEVARLASLALEDDPNHSKSSLRLARARIELGELREAAAVVDRALSRVAADSDVRVELWKLAEEISKSLPDVRWSCSRPKASEAKKQQDDYEKKIVGFWEYGPDACYEIRLEPWGALVFHEENIKIDLMRKGLLRWRGELELISGMVLNVSYEPGSDVLVTEFIPPPDMPAEQQWQGQKKFTSKRSKKSAPKAEPEPPAKATDEAPTPVKPSPVAAEEAPKAPEAPPVISEQERIAAALQGAPREVWLAGHPQVEGRYEVVSDRIENDRPVYLRGLYSSGSRELFLWCRGGNWGVTEKLHSSSLAAPFLARCPDPSGRARHPLELRRPRWHVRTGRGQEQPDASLQLLAERPKAAFEASAPSSAGRADGAASSAGEADAQPPTWVEIAGRSGEQSEINGLYSLSASAWGGRPVYLQEDYEVRPLALFYENGYWTVAAEACSLPRALARCAAPASTSPLAARGAWEVLCGERFAGAMVTTETREYKVDRQVCLTAKGGAQPPPASSEPPPTASSAPAEFKPAARVAQAALEAPAAASAPVAAARVQAPAEAGLDDMD